MKLNSNDFNIQARRPLNNKNLNLEDEKKCLHLIFMRQIPYSTKLEIQIFKQNGRTIKGRNRSFEY